MEYSDKSISRAGVFAWIRAKKVIFRARQKRASLDLGRWLVLRF